VVCPTRGCHSIPMDWVIPTDEVLANMSILQNEPTEPTGDGSKTPPPPRESFATRLQKLARQFRRVA
jgi:hypothetical protein